MSVFDLNCDMGESFGPWQMGHDADVMPHITSANVACGGHAGDPAVMARTVRLAKEHGVAVGAHPGYADLVGFGRRIIPMTADDIRLMVLAQIGALWAVARGEGVEISHIKAHGALYNLSSRDAAVAQAIASAAASFSRALPLYCLPGSVMEHAAHELGLSPVAEGFVDRAYQPNGQLADRNLPGAVYSSTVQAVRQALLLAQGAVTCLDGTQIRLEVRTLCLHGDNPLAPAIASAVRSALLEAGHNVQPVLRV